MLKFAVFVAQAFAAPQSELIDILSNLQDMSSAMNKIDFTTASNSSVLEPLLIWKENFESTVEEGGSARYVRELEQRGRRLKLTMLSKLLSADDANSDMDLEKLNGYGCYGTPLSKDDSNFIGKGQPVDAIDQLGYKLMQCYRCVVKDYEGKCHADTPYRYKIRNGEFVCQEREGQCKSVLCECDYQYLEELKKLWTTWNPVFHINSGFDRSLSCKTKPESNRARVAKEKSGSLQEPKCCGTGLNRFVYKPSVFDCCEDGSVKPIGEC